MSVTKVPDLGDKRLYVDSFVLDFPAERDALDCVGAVTRALRGGGKKPCLDLQDPAVQTYVASLLIDPDFDAFVHDLARFYDRLRTNLPTTAGGHVMSSTRQVDDTSHHVASG